MRDHSLTVLIVDDTVVYRRILSEVVESLPDTVLAGTAPHGRLAMTRLEQNPVDLVLLDVEMPEMDGLETLKEIRRLHPATSVVMVSGTNMSSAEITLRCLEQGAIDFLRKPEGSDVEASRNELKEKLRPLVRHVQTRLNLQRGSSPARAPSAPPAPSPVKPLVQPEAPLPPRPVRSAPLPSRFDVVGIGVSTGGPNALLEVVPKLPADFPLPILLVQHMPPLFTASLAEHLDQKSKLSVREAKDGEAILPGSVLIAPGGKHMVVRRYADGEKGGAVPVVGLNENPPEHSCRPSVDVLFRSIAAQYEGNMLAVIMTGMGSDGCEGVRAMKRRGCLCLAQTESTCVVYGMPLAVDEAGLSDERIPLERLADRLIHLAKKGRGL
jgi:two-component system chemotaxis response regulator CheB